MELHNIMNLSKEYDISARRVYMYLEKGQELLVLSKKKFPIKILCKVTSVDFEHSKAEDHGRRAKQPPSSTPTWT